MVESKKLASRSHHDRFQRSVVTVGGLRLWGETTIEENGLVFGIGKML
jgi:hypothetical protein